MSWMEQLYKTYENNIGKHTQDDVALTPLAHIYQNAQIEISLDKDGNFCGAHTVDKKEAATLIPVTEASAGRSSGIAPHALSDTLSYIAGDFTNYCHEGKLKKTSEEKYQCYMEQLKAWCKSEYTHIKVNAIYQYLDKKMLISDLIKAGIVTLSDDETFDDKKISGQPYEKAIVRFRVLCDENVPNSTWEDATLINAYTKYLMSTQGGKNDRCYLTGEIQIRTENHPKGIVAANYGAKLVSANDTQGFVYRGRFRNSEEAYSLSYETSQKIHSALTWLAKKQGVFIGTTDKRTFICWNPEGKETPNIFNPLGLYEDNEEESDNSNILYKKRLFKTLQGYRDQFVDTDNVIIIGLDAATTGRLSITYYNELSASDFLNRIIYWGETCNWLYLKFTEQKQPYYRLETPTFRRIAECAFGREQGNFIELNDKVLKEQVQRLMKCMLDRQPMPRDIVSALVNRASMPLAYSRNNRETLLATTCATIIKYYTDKGIMKGEYDEMKLNLENRDRSYLFGRLLAVFEKVERSTYEKGENREPNAIRLQSAYVNHPLKTWKTLEDALKPYFQKLKPGSREYYKRLISEITEQFCEEDSSLLNQELKETYLLGYYLQRAELNKKKDEQKEEIINE